MPSQLLFLWYVSLEKCSPTIFITSTGLAQTHHSSKLGKYTEDGYSNGYNSYKHPSGYYLHFDFNLHEWKVRKFARYYRIFFQNVLLSENIPYTYHKDFSYWKSFTIPINVCFIGIEKERIYLVLFWVQLRHELPTALHRNVGDVYWRRLGKWLHPCRDKSR